MFFNSKLKSKARPPIKGADIQKTIDISFTDSIKENLKINIDYQRKCTCKSCKGSKAEPGCMP